jgi:branched-chain amino acid transport system permease protein
MSSCCSITLRLFLPSLARRALAGCCPPRFGLALNAIRDDEDKAESKGLQTHTVKVTAWVIAASFLGAAGAIYGNQVRFIDPTETPFAGATIGVWMILMALLGGKGTLLGPIVGAILFQITKELTWTYLIGWQRVALGILIIAVAVFFPSGIVGVINGRLSGKRAAPNTEEQDP